MAHTACRMAVTSGGELGGLQCAGCFRQFVSTEQMNAMQYNSGKPAGWHCDDCVAIWKEKGEEHLPRWAKPFPAATTGGE